MCQALLAGRIDKQAEDQIGEFVTGRALDRPVVTQHLVPSEDFLDNKVEGPGRLLAEPQKVSLWVEQPVHMVDAQAVQHALAQELENEVVRLIEQLRQLHAQAGQLVDVEEASVIDVVRGDAEVRRTPVLILDQYIQPPPGLESDTALDNRLISRGSSIRGSSQARSMPGFPRALAKHC